MTTAAKTNVPAMPTAAEKRALRKVLDDAQNGPKTLTKAHKAKLASALDGWRESLTDEERDELRERNRATQQARWANMSERERKERLAGVKAWQAAKRAKAKATPKPGATKAPAKASRRTEAAPKAAPARTVEVIGPDGTSKPSAKNNVLANRKAVAK